VQVKISYLKKSAIVVLLMVNVVVTLQ